MTLINLHLLLGLRKIRVPYSDLSVCPSVCASVCASVRLDRNGYAHFAVAIGATFTKLTPTDLLIPHGGLCPWPTFHAWVTMVRKKWLSLYYSTYGCYIHQTCTSCSSWHDLLIPHGILCPWPTFHAWVTMVRKKWLSLYYSTYGCYIH